MNATDARSRYQRLPPFLRVTVRRWIKLFRSGSSLGATFTDIAIRITIAQSFLRSGLVKAGNWDTALALARFEYPVSWMAPDTAALTGLLIELVAPVLLLLGLFTRPAALAAAALLIVSQAVYVPTTTNLIIIVVLLHYALAGPGPISLDRHLARGFRTSALPFAGLVVATGEWLRQHVAPWWILCVRLWLAVTLLAGASMIDMPVAAATWLPVSVFGGAPPWLAMLLAGLLALGVFTSTTALLLLLSGAILTMMGIHPDVTLYPVLLVALYEDAGPGRLGLDNVINAWLEKNILFDREHRMIPDSWPHVVVVGAGFGGVAAVNKLRRLPVRVTLVDRRNYHLFQPLLYQIATATLNPADIATPIRSLFREDGNVRVVKGTVSGVDTDNRLVLIEDGEPLAYDKLVIATGASHSYFGRDEWRPFAPGLKTVEDAVSVRSAILDAFERAEASADPARVRRLLNFVIVGAGPTGVELAGAIAELASESVAREFRAIDPSMAQVTLVQSGPRVLPAFPEMISDKATAALESLGVEVRTGSRVTRIAPDHVCIGSGEVIETETVIWAAGVVASAAGSWLPCETDAAGRVVVDPHLRVASAPGVFAIGDTALSMAWDGAAVPGLAPAAKQQGSYVASVIEAELFRMSDPPEPFTYRHQGSLATIGRKQAVADFGKVRLSGALAWWLWGVVHVGFLTGARNRATVLLNWAWNYFTHQAGIRLITGRGQAM